MVQLFDRLLTQVREDVIRLIKYYVLNLGYTFCYRGYYYITWYNFDEVREAVSQLNIF